MARGERQIARVAVGGFRSHDGVWFQPVVLRDRGVVVTVTMDRQPEPGSWLPVEEYQPGAYRVADAQLQGAE